MGMFRFNAQPGDWSWESRRWDCWLPLLCRAVACTPPCAKCSLEEETGSLISPVLSSGFLALFFWVYAGPRGWQYLVKQVWVGCGPCDPMAIGLGAGSTGWCWSQQLQARTSVGPVAGPGIGASWGTAVQSASRQLGERRWDKGVLTLQNCSTILQARLGWETRSTFFKLKYHLNISKNM